MLQSVKIFAVISQLFSDCVSLNKEINVRADKLIIIFGCQYSEKSDAFIFLDVLHPYIEQFAPGMIFIPCITIIESHE